MIPALMCPTINRHDLMWRMLRSVDVPVARLLLIDNARSGIEVPDDIRSKFPHLVVFAPPYEGLGYGGAINFLITQNPDAPWVMWVSNDVEFQPGHLQTVADRMNATSEPRIVTGGFTWGAVNPALIDQVGLVDDWSFFPIYYDDNDYHYRCRLSGVEWIEDGGPGWVHGDGTHAASLTINSDQRARDNNGRTFRANQAAYIAKWGGLPHEERFTSPWDTGWPVWVTRPDIQGRNIRHWR